MKMISKIFEIVLISALIVFVAGIFSLLSIFLPKQIPKQIKEALEPKKARVIYQFTPTGGQLITGAEVAASLTNISTWRGLAADLE